MLQKKMAKAEEDLVMMLEMCEEAENDVQKLTKWIRPKRSRRSSSVLGTRRMSSYFWHGATSEIS